VKIARALLLAELAGLCGCGTNFDPPSKIEGVRILAIQADKPYAQPGETVTLSMLAFDGRPKKPAPMRLFWVPTVCHNPSNDAYFACYSELAAKFKPGVDLTPSLVKNAQFSFPIPANLVDAHGAAKQSSPYGMVVVFAMACAGHVQYTPPAADTVPPAPPLGCFDDEGKPLGPDDSVFAYAQVFSFPGRTNANPVLDHLTFGGKPVDPEKGITIEPCTAKTQEKCASTALDAVVPSSSQEPDPGDVTESGAKTKEEIWVDYYLTDGQVKNGAVLLYDAQTGKRTKTATSLQAPLTKGEQRLWAVAHDNRGGVAWIDVPMHVKKK
jgi:hypothetical protein